MKWFNRLSLETRQMLLAQANSIALKQIGSPLSNTYDAKWPSNDSARAFVCLVYLQLREDLGVSINPIEPEQTP